MTEKRFTAVIYEDYEKSLFFDNKGEERSLTDYEILNLLNELNEELESKEKAHTRCDELYQKLYDENEQLKKELEKFRKWEKHIRDVRREDLDRVFKMSIYEIAEAFDYYKERIKKLEKELQE